MPDRASDGPAPRTSDADAVPYVVAAAAVTAASVVVAAALDPAWPWARLLPVESWVRAVTAR